MSKEAAPYGPTEWRKYIKKTLILAFEVIGQTLAHPFFKVLFFHYIGSLVSFDEITFRYVGISTYFEKDSNIIMSHRNRVISLVIQLSLMVFLICVITNKYDDATAFTDVLLSRWFLWHKVCNFQEHICTLSNFDVSHWFHLNWNYPVYQCLKQVLRLGIKFFLKIV